MRYILTYHLYLPHALKVLIFIDTYFGFILLNNLVEIFCFDTELFLCNDSQSVTEQNILKPLQNFIGYCHGSFKIPPGDANISQQQESPEIEENLV